MARFILINTSHAGNVGAAARALKVMGFDDMVLVAPRWANVLRREETIQRASGANDVLDKTRIVETLDEALDGVDHLCATAMTPRDFGPPTFAVRAYFDALLNKELLPQYSSGLKPDLACIAGAAKAVAEEAVKTTLETTLETATRIATGTPTEKATAPRMAFLFGSERFGMRNEDVYRCHAALNIPTNPQFGSLNLASAVQLVAYEWRQVLGGFAVQGAHPATPVADARAVSGLLTHLEQALIHIGYLDPAAPKKLMPRLNALLNRAELREEEIHILRGVAKAMLQAQPAAQQGKAALGEATSTMRINTHPAPIPD
jgi:tRNA/rRNA methyltransferase